jgi:hypothetical protein
LKAGRSDMEEEGYSYTVTVEVQASGREGREQGVQSDLYI